MLQVLNNLLELNEFPIVQSQTLKTSVELNKLQEFSLRNTGNKQVVGLTQVTKVQSHKSRLRWTDNH